MSTANAFLAYRKLRQQQKQADSGGFNFSQLPPELIGALGGAGIGALGGLFSGEGVLRKSLIGAGLGGAAGYGYRRLLGPGGQSVEPHGPPAPEGYQPPVRPAGPPAPEGYQPPVRPAGPPAPEGVAGQLGYDPYAGRDPSPQRVPYNYDGGLSQILDPYAQPDPYATSRNPDRRGHLNWDLIRQGILAPGYLNPAGAAGLRVDAIRSLEGYGDHLGEQIFRR